MATIAEPEAKFTDTRTLRENARKDIEQGPVTSSYPKDREVIVEQLNKALATEWVCVMRYMRHYYMADGMVSEPIKAHFLAHAQEEQGHADQLAERIVQLGGEPDLDPATFTGRSHAEYREGNSLKDMVKENLVAERIAVEAYKELIAYVADRDPTTRTMLEGILAMEEDHADEFRDLLEGWQGD